jgi:hypothetical protein
MLLDRDASPDEQGFDQQLITWFVEHSRSADGTDEPSPTWNHRRGSDHVPAAGLWAVEPHISRGAIGVKWEELLVVGHGEPFWLDDPPPHLAGAVS